MSWTGNCTPFLCWRCRIWLWCRCLHYSLRSEPFKGTYFLRLLAIATGSKWSKNIWFVINLDTCSSRLESYHYSGMWLDFPRFCQTTHLLEWKHRKLVSPSGCDCVQQYLGNRCNGACASWYRKNRMVLDPGYALLINAPLENGAYHWSQQRFCFLLVLVTDIDLFARAGAGAGDVHA